MSRSAGMSLLAGWRIIHYQRSTVMKALKFIELINSILYRIWFFFYNRSKGNLLVKVVEDGWINVQIKGILPASY